MRIFKKINLSILTIIILGMCVFLSCNDTNSGLHEQVELIEIKFKNEKKKRIDISEILQTKIAIPLETKVNNYMNGVNRIVQYKDSIFLVHDNMGNLYKFDNRGKYLGDIGSGRVSDFCVDEKRELILLFKINGSDLYEYTINNELIRTLKMPFAPYEIGVLNKEHLAFSLNYDGENFMNLKITDTEVDNILDSKFSMPKSTTRYSSYNVTGHITEDRNGGLLYSGFYSSFIHQIDYRGKDSPKYRIDFEESFIPENKRYDLIKLYNKLQNGEFNFLSNDFEENEKALVFGYVTKLQNNNVKEHNRHRNAYFLKRSQSLYTNESFYRGIVSSSLSAPKGITQSGMFISVLSSEDIIDFKKENKEITIGDKKLKKIIDDVKEGDNPIIYIFDVVEK